MATVEKQQCSSFQIRWVLKCFVNIFIPSSLELTTHLFGLAKNRDLFVINKKIHHWTHLCYKDSCFGWEHPVEMDHTWKFLVAKNRDLNAIKKSNTNSKKT
jgi:hypothetical protein